MFVKKGDIYRNIDEKRLSEYTAKGYTRVKEDEKAIEKMNAEELTKKAEELGVDISAAKTNKEKAQVIFEHIEKSNHTKE